MSVYFRCVGFLCLEVHSMLSNT